MNPSFVLVHGGNVGGWQWQNTARILRRAGHEVHAPSLSGHGERSHLTTAAGLSFEVWADDIVSLIEYEDLDDIVLVGHSMGGIIIPMVAARVPKRIRRVVWTAALVLKDGEPMRPHVERAQRARAAAHPEGAKVDWAEIGRERGGHPGSGAAAGTPEWVLDRLTPSPDWIRDTPARGLAAFLELGLPTGYVLATRDTSLTPDVCREFASRLPGCHYLEVDASHNLMASRPEITANALLEMARHGSGG